MVLLLLGEVLRRRAHAELGRRAKQVLRGGGERSEHVAWGSAETSQEGALGVYSLDSRGCIERGC